MRSGTGTKSGEPGVETLSTKATMDCLALPSFQDGRGSPARAAVAKALAMTSAIPTTLDPCLILMVIPLASSILLGDPNAAADRRPRSAAA